MSLRSHIIDLADKGYSRQEIFDSIRPQMLEYGIKNPKKLAERVLNHPTQTIWQKNKRAYQFLVGLISISAITQILAGIQFANINNLNMAIALLFPLANFVFLYFLATKRLSIFNPIALLNIVGYVQGFKQLELESNLDYFVFGTTTILIVSIVSNAYYLKFKMCKPFTVESKTDQESKDKGLTLVITFPKEDRTNDEDILV